MATTKPRHVSAVLKLPRRVQDIGAYTQSILTCAADVAVEDGDRRVDSRDRLLLPLPRHHEGRQGRLEPGRLSPRHLTRRNRRRPLRDRSRRLLVRSARLQVGSVERGFS